MFAIENTPIFSAIEIALNRVLAQHESLLADCGDLQGEFIGLKLRDIGRTIVFAPHAKGITVLAPPQLMPGQAITATIEASVAVLARAALNRDEPGLPTGMQLTGDTEVARKFSHVLQQLDLDWEEHLAQQVGDVLAHQIGEGVRSLFGWGKTVVESVSRDAAEFVREEAQQTPHPDEVEEFFQDVDQLRDDVDRLTARLNRLAEKASREKG